MKSSARTALPVCCGTLPSSQISSQYQVFASSEGSRTHHSSEGTFWPNPHWRKCRSDPPITQLAAAEAPLQRAMRRCYDNSNGSLVKALLDRDNEQSGLREKAGIAGSRFPRIGTGIGSPGRLARLGTARWPRVQLLRTGGFLGSSDEYS